MVAKLTAKKKAKQTAGREQKLYTLDVFIIGGPMTESFLKETRVISRTILQYPGKGATGQPATPFNSFQNLSPHQ